MFFSNMEIKRISLKSKILNYQFRDHSAESMTWIIIFGDTMSTLINVGDTILSEVTMFDKNRW